MKTSKVSGRLPNVHPYFCKVSFLIHFNCFLKRRRHKLNDLEFASVASGLRRPRLHTE